MRKTGQLIKWPADGKFEVPGLQSKVTKAYLLASRKELKVNQSAGRVTIALPAEAPDKIASVICLEIADQDSPACIQTGNSEYSNNRAVCNSGCGCH